MKVGVYIGFVIPPEMGGSSSFQMSVLHELQKSFKNECVVYYESNEKCNFESTKTFSFVNLSKSKLPRRPFCDEKKEVDQSNI